MQSVSKLSLTIALRCANVAVCMAPLFFARGFVAGFLAVCSCELQELRAMHVSMFGKGEGRAVALKSHTSHLSGLLHRCQSPLSLPACCIGCRGVAAHAALLPFMLTVWCFVPSRAGTPAAGWLLAPQATATHPSWTTSCSSEHCCPCWHEQWHCRWVMRSACKPVIWHKFYRLADC